MNEIWNISIIIRRNAELKYIEHSKGKAEAELDAEKMNFSYILQIIQAFRGGPEMGLWVVPEA